MAGTGTYKVTVTVTDKDTGRTLEQSLTTGSEMVEDPEAWAHTLHTDGEDVRGAARGAVVRRAEAELVRRLPTDLHREPARCSPRPSRRPGRSGCTPAWSSIPFRSGSMRG
jgi:hypothetical protein